MKRSPGRATRPLSEEPVSAGIPGKVNPQENKTAHGLAVGRPANRSRELYSRMTVLSKQERVEGEHRSRKGPRVAPEKCKADQESLAENTRVSDCRNRLAGGTLDADRKRLP